MVRVGDAVGAAAATVGLTVTRLLSYTEKNGLPPLNVLYTSDEDQAWYFLRNRLNSSVLGLDIQWKPVLKGKPTSRSSVLQVAAGDWVLIYDVLPTPWYGTPAQALSERMCEFFEEKGRTFYGMLLPVDAARMAFELDCVISRGVDLRKNPWPGSNTTGGMVHLGNRLLNTTVREDRKVAISNWEWRPLTGQQLRYMAEKAYVSWAIADHFLKKGRPSKASIVTKAQIYGAGARLRKAGLALEKTTQDWSRAKKQWLREVKRRREEAEAAEAAAEAEEAEKKEKKRRARASKVTQKSKKGASAAAEPEAALPSVGSQSKSKKEKESEGQRSRRSGRASIAARELVEDAAKGKAKKDKSKAPRAAAGNGDKAAGAGKDKQSGAQRKHRRKQAAQALAAAS